MFLSDTEEVLCEFKVCLVVVGSGDLHPLIYAYCLDMKIT